MATSPALPTPRTKFFAFVNRTLTDQNKDTLVPDDYPTVTPVPYSGVRSTRNTVVFLDPPLNSSAVGRSTVFLNRIDLSTVTGLVVEKGTATTFLDLLPAINDALGMNFSITDFTTVASLPASGVMTITASATCLLHFGTLTFTLAV